MDDDLAAQCAALRIACLRYAALPGTLFQPTTTVPCPRSQVLLGKKGTRRPPARQGHWQRWTSQFPWLRPHSRRTSCRSIPRVWVDLLDKDLHSRLTHTLLQVHPHWI